MKKNFMFLIFTVFTIVNIFGIDTKKELEKAQKSGKSIFLVVTDKSSTGTEGLIKIANEASKKNKNTTVIKLDRDDKENADLIKKYRLAGAPLPVILVMASNGVVSGALFTKDAAVDKLLSYLPTKTQAEVLLGFENGKAAFIVCGKKNAKDRTTIENECKKAATSLKNKATIVFLDVDDEKEANFLALLKPSKDTTTLLVFNGTGQFTRTLNATAKSDEIIKTVNKKMGGCCPGGSGGGCGK